MILLDNTVLSNFALIHHPDLIRQAFIEAVGSTDQVFQELERGVKLGRLPKVDWNWLPKLQVSDAEDAQFRRLAMFLGIGEASCLSIAFQRKYKIATDDKDARRWALRFMIPFTGTLGIVAILVKQKKITLIEGNYYLQQMIEMGYHSPLPLLDELVKI